jgi:S1-C subfamily serine protease
VLGYPENGPYSVAPARLGETRPTISEDSYGNGPIDRTIVALRGSVRSGNSGGPLVDGRGRVVGTVFAATTSGTAGGFAIPAEDVREVLSETAASVATGPCTD